MAIGEQARDRGRARLPRKPSARVGQPPLQTIRLGAVLVPDLGGLQPSDVAQLDHIPLPRRSREMAVLRSLREVLGGGLPACHHTVGCLRHVRLACLATTSVSLQILRGKIQRVRTHTG
jgi:hypothetical protein